MSGGALACFGSCGGTSGSSGNSRLVKVAVLCGMSGGVCFENCGGVSGSSREVGTE